LHWARNDPQLPRINLGSLNAASRTEEAMEELTNKVDRLSCYTPVPLTPKAQPAQEIIDQAQALEDAGNAEAALGMVFEAEQNGNVVPFRKLVAYASARLISCAGKLR
jgi:hypothetical protein